MVLTASSVMLSRPSSNAVTIMRASSWPRVGSRSVWALRRSSSSSPPISRGLNGWAALRGFWGWKRCWGRKQDIQAFKCHSQLFRHLQMDITSHQKHNKASHDSGKQSVLKLLASNFCLDGRGFFPFCLTGFEAEPPCHCKGPVPSRGENRTKHQVDLRHTDENLQQQIFRMSWRVISWVE